MPGLLRCAHMPESHFADRASTLGCRMRQIALTLCVSWCRPAKTWSGGSRLRSTTPTPELSSTLATADSAYSTVTRSATACTSSGNEYTTLSSRLHPSARRLPPRWPLTQAARPSERTRTAWIRTSRRLLAARRTGRMRGCRVGLKVHHVADGVRGARYLLRYR